MDKKHSAIHIYGPMKGEETRTDDLDGKWDELQTKLTNETGGEHLLRIRAKQECLRKIEIEILTGFVLTEN